MSILLSHESKAIGGIVLTLLLAQLALIYKQAPRSPLHALRIGLILVAAITSLIALLFTSQDGFLLTLFVTLLVGMEEAIGRWLFYRSR